MANDMLDINALCDIYEETIAQLKGNTDKARHLRAKKQPIHVYFKDVAKSGLVKFDVTSGTIRGKMYRVNIWITDTKGFAKDLQKAYTQHKKVSLAKLMNDYFKRDVKISCTCPDFHYRWKYTAYTFKFGIIKEMRPARIRNPYNRKCVCKHILAMFSVLAFNWSTIVKAMKSKGVIPDNKNMDNSKYARKHSP